MVALSKIQENINELVRQYYCWPEESAVCAGKDQNFINHTVLWR